MSKFLEEVERERSYGVDLLGKVKGIRKYDIHYCEEGETWIPTHKSYSKFGELITVPGHCAKVPKRKLNPIKRLTRGLL